MLSARKSRQVGREAVDVTPLGLASLFSTSTEAFYTVGSLLQ
jgi:hypothetical protein